jgi:alkylhydroperoxidase/carboxymuconolactone decarboxylase family protein YurZ
MFRPQTYGRRAELFEDLDPSFAHTWSRHVGRLLSRPGLDARRRSLIFVSQFTMLGNVEALEELLEGAIGRGMDPVELLEAMLQCYTYAGESKVEAAASVFRAVATRTGRIDEVRRRTRARTTPPPPDLESLRAQWPERDRCDPRVDTLVDRYGSDGLLTGLALRPGHIINLATTLDAVDPDFLRTWLSTVHAGLYSRGVIDHGTRLLCTIGVCFAVGETHQSRRHMRNALREGVTPSELLEVIFQSMATVGHPGLMPMAIDDLILIADDMGRLEELVSAERLAEVRAITDARVERRSGTDDPPATL